MAWVLFTILLAAHSLVVGSNPQARPFRCEKLNRAGLFTWKAKHAINLNEVLAQIINFHNSARRI